MENEEKKKKGIGKKVVLWIIGVIIVLFIIGCLDEDTTPTSSDIVNEVASTTNNINENSDNFINNKNIELSEKSYSGATFKITYSDLKKKCDEVGLKEQSYEVEANAPTYNNDVITDMWCFQAYRQPTLQEKAVGANTVPYDAYYFKITYEKSTQMVVEIQLIGLVDVEDKILNQMYKNYSILLGCIDSNIYNNVAKNLENMPFKELKDNVYYLGGITKEYGNEAVSIITTACSEDEYKYYIDNGNIWSKQVNQ